MDTVVSVEPIPMQLRQMLNRTTSQTALTGVQVYALTVLQSLYNSQLPASTTARTAAHRENGRASSRANAYAILVSANMAEQPVKNWTKITQAHITVPPVLPPALKKI
jgi:hypothetical protein